MTPSGKLWVGSCFGISIFDGINWQDFVKGSGEFLEPCVAWKIIMDKNNIIWMATGRGLISIEGEKQQIYTVEDGLPDNNIYDVIIGEDNAIWVISNAGFSRYLPPVQQ